MEFGWRESGQVHAFWEILAQQFVGVCIVDAALSGLCQFGEIDLHVGKFGKSLGHLPPLHLGQGMPKPGRIRYLTQAGNVSRNRSICCTSFYFL